MTGGLDGMREAHARRTDPTTSHEAAATVNLPPTRARVLEVFRATGYVMTDKVLVDLFRRRFGDIATESSIRSRRAELARDGLITHIGETTGSHGRRERTWQIEERAAKALRNGEQDA